MTLISKLLGFILLENGNLISLPILSHTHNCVSKIEVTTSASKWTSLTTAIIFPNWRSSQQVYIIHLIEDTNEDANTQTPQIKALDSFPEMHPSVSVTPEFIDRDELICCRHGHVEKSIF